MTEDIRHKFNRLTFYTLLFTFLGISMTFIIFSSVGLPTVTCPAGQAVSQIGTVADKCVTTSDQISFDSAVFGNSSVATSIETATLPNPTQGEMMIVALSAPSLLGVVSVVDSALDVFTPRLTVRSSLDSNFEIWTGFAGTASPLTITATWNASNPTLLMVSTYKNAVAVGSKNFTQGAGITSLSMTITTTVNGGWIVGGSSIFPATPVTQCSAISPGAFLIQRVNSCSDLAQTGIWGDVEDNATVLRNQFKFTYSSSWPNTLGPPDGVIGAIEILPKDNEPLQLNQCSQIIGSVCTQYALNTASKTSGINVLNTPLTALTTYCTGITTSGLTLSTISKGIQAWGTYGGTSLNVTGAKLLIQFKIGTTAPSTTFGSGTCAAGTIIGTASIYFAISGAVSQTTTFSTAINAFCTTALCPVSATYFAWFDITPQNFVGAVNFDQVVNQAYSTASISIMEIK